jgi:hypothetical protein
VVYGPVRTAVEVHHCLYSRGCVVQVQHEIYGSHRAGTSRGGTQFCCRAGGPKFRAAASAVHELSPDALRMPDRFHVRASLGFIDALHIAPISIEKRRDSVVRDAVDVDRDIP